LKIVHAPSGVRKLPTSAKMDWRSMPAVATITTSTLKVKERTAFYARKYIIHQTQYTVGGFCMLVTLLHDVWSGNTMR
jgi:hypothetical protein